MAIKFSQFNERTASTATMTLVGYDGNQNIRILADDLFQNPYISGTENTLAMFGTGGTVLADSIVSQDAGAALLTVGGQLNVDAAATFDTSITVLGDSILSGDIVLGNETADIITQNGTLYLNGPIKDTTDTLGAADQILVSDASGELTFTDSSTITVESAEVVQVPVKNLQGSPLTKGDPVYISGSVGASGRLEVQLADASNPAKMPAVGLLKQDLAINEEGYAVVTGKLRNLPTDPIGGSTPLPNAVIYVKAGGTTGAALTLIKPTGSNLIQNMGKVGRVSTVNDGTLVVSSILRTNDIPNLTQGKIWVGSTGNTIESGVVHLDEVNNRMLINTTTPTSTLSPDFEIGGGGSPTIILNAATSAPLNYSSNYIYATRNNSTTPPLGALGWDNNPGFDGVRLNARSILTYQDSALELSTNAGGTSKIKILNSDVITIPNSTLNVGIGTTTPGAKLHVSGGAIRIDDTQRLEFGNGSVRINNDAAGRMYLRAPLAYYFEGNSGYKMVLEGNSGNLGIGTTTPVEKLDVSGGVQFDNGDFNVLNSSSGNFGGRSIARFRNGADLIQLGDVEDYNTSARLDIDYFNQIANFQKLNVGIDTASPGAALDVNGGIRMANDTGTPSASNVGTLRYYTSGNNSYVDMCMQTGASTYAWVNIVQNNW